jgi:hypothetical protein
MLQGDRKDRWVEVGESPVGENAPQRAEAALRPRRRVAHERTRPLVFGASSWAFGRPYGMIAERSGLFSTSATSAGSGLNGGGASRQRVPVSL